MARMTSACEASRINPPNDSTSSCGASGSQTGSPACTSRVYSATRGARGTPGVEGTGGVCATPGTSGIGATSWITNRIERDRDLNFDLFIRSLTMTSSMVGAGSGVCNDDSTWPLNEDSVTLTFWPSGTATSTRPLCDANE